MNKKSQSVFPVPVSNGKLKIGFFDKLFSKMNLSDISRPYGNLPYPAVLFKFRKRNMLTFTFSDEKYIGKIFIFGSRLFYFIETVIWERKTLLKFAYRKLGLFSRLRFPSDLLHSHLTCRTTKRYLRINSRLEKQEISLYFDFEGDSVRPDLTGSFVMQFPSKQPNGASFSNRWFLRKTCMASMQLHAPLSAWLRIRGVSSEDYDFLPEKTSGFLDIRQGFYPMRTRIHFLTGTGKLVIQNKEESKSLDRTSEEQTVSFQFAGEWNFDSPNSIESVLLIGERSIQLPSVKITRPYGPLGNWIIQDTESMVDLVFIPKSDNHRNLSVFVLRTDYHTVYGTFEGEIVTPEGQKLTIKGFPGIGNKILLRM